MVLGYPGTQGELVAQPGTVIFMTQQSCLPGRCGDNSTSFTIVIDGIPLERLNTENALDYAGRVPNFDFNSVSGNRDMTIVTEYQTFRVQVFLSFRLVRQPPMFVVSPSVGQRGTRVDIQGSGLLEVYINAEVNRVLLGSNEADIVRTSSSEMVIQVRARSGSYMENGSVTINTTQLFDNRLYDGPYIYIENSWTQLSDGSITRIVPQAAQEGSEILVCGARILGGGNTISSVQLDSVSFPLLASLPGPHLLNITEPECLQVQVGSGTGATTTTGRINVTSDTGAFVESTENFTIARIDSITPSIGQPGTIVTVRGQGLLSGTNPTSVLAYLSDVSAYVISFSDTEIVLRARDPPTPIVNVINETTGATEAPDEFFGVMGGVQISVPNPYNASMTFTVSTLSGWQLEERGVITNVDPEFGQVGTLITVTGTNLLAYGNMLTHATIGGVNATILNGANSNQVQLVTPSITIGSIYDIILYSNTGATIRDPLAFENLEPGIITVIMPNQGQNGTFGEL